jgi:hypothetical protein
LSASSLSSSLASASLPLSSPLVRLRIAKPERVRLRIGTAMSAFDAVRADERNRRVHGNHGSTPPSGVIRRRIVAPGLHYVCKILKNHIMLAFPF